MGLLSFFFRKPKQAKSEPPIRPTPRYSTPHGATPIARATPAVETYRGAAPIIQWRDGSYPMDVVGESNYQSALVAICGRHTRHGHESLYTALLKLEPSNRYDPNAVQVLIDNQLVGYLPREQAARLKGQMDEANLTEVRCRARVRGGWRTNQYDEGHYGVQLSMPTMGWIDLGIGAERPAPVKSAPKPQKVAVSDGPLSGQRIAIMGESRDPHLAEQLEAAGARIMATVGKTSTLLVVAMPRPFTPGAQQSAQYLRAIEYGVMIVSADEIRARISGDEQPLP